ncbi:hypothetical protein [Bosea rubneri]|uniref:Secreted protein n=1 Tax=Bosea rubneri TaxID=3075434 RepID=A0ABU3S651_9HYPH|nr:hypothetical protein [Bosea sp. ZW T0_25]MDU0339855.1 hypothetical protein [Bosea sp. ZW T0_25]
MIRALAVATLAIMLVPASAEAAKFRFGGSRSSDSQTSSSNRDGSLIVTPGLRSRQTSQPAAAQSPRAASPNRAAEPLPLRLTAAEEPRVWCRSQVVVGGFCVLN